jgi:GNAT superfamily N-acetyltransferase
MTPPAGYAVRVLNFLEGVCFTNMTFGTYQPLLLAGPSGGRAVAVGAYHEGKPVALALSEFTGGAGTAEVLSLFCDPAHRRRGLGTALLAATERELAARGCRRATATWSSGAAGAAAVERILRARGWSPPQARMLLCRADEPFLRAPFLRPPLFPLIERGLGDAEVFPWVRLSAADRASIARRQAESPWIPDDLRPELYEADLEPLTSFGLRVNGDVVGWLLTHRLSPLVVRYTCSFVRRDLAQRGAVLLLYGRAIRDQYAALPKGTQAIWTVPMWHREMVDFVRQRMAPYLTSLSETRGAEKALDGAG